MFAQAVKKIIIILLIAATPVFCDDEAGEETGELSLTSPFYLPYAEEFTVEGGIAVYSRGTKIELLSLSGTRETSSKAGYAALTARYGFTDRIALGVFAKYMIRQDFAQTQTGVLAASPAIRSTNNGFYDIGFSLSARLLGTRREEWYLNVEAAFAPGIRDNNNFSFSYPNNQYVSKLSFGRGVGDWTFGVIGSVLYYQSSSYDTTNEKNDETMGAAQLLLQYDFPRFYFRLSPGVVKFLDNRSNTDALKKKVFPAGTVELGFPLSDDSLLSAGLLVVPSQSANSSSGGTNFSVSSVTQVTGTLALLARF